MARGWSGGGHEVVMRWSWGCHEVVMRSIAPGGVGQGVGAWSDNIPRSDSIATRAGRTYRLLVLPRPRPPPSPHQIAGQRAMAAPSPGPRPTAARAASVGHGPPFWSRAGRPHLAYPLTLVAARGGRGNNEPDSASAEFASRKRVGKVDMTFASCCFDHLYYAWSEPHAQAVVADVFFPHFSNK